MVTDNNISSCPRRWARCTGRILVTCRTSGRPQAGFSACSRTTATSSLSKHLLRRHNSRLSEFSSSKQCFQSSVQSESDSTRSTADSTRVLSTCIFNVLNRTCSRQSHTQSTIRKAKRNPTPPNEREDFTSS